MPRWPNRTPEERFWSNVDKSGECWLWALRVDREGYGRFKLDGRYVGAHRFAYERSVGPISDGMHVCHHCDNPRCVRPEHLFVGTASDNAQDRQRKGRSGFQRQPELVKSGVEHHAAKLNPDAVEGMRGLRSVFGLPYRTLGVLSGVSTSTAHDVCTGQWWRDSKLSGELSGTEAPCPDSSPDKP